MKFPTWLGAPRRTLGDCYDHGQDNFLLLRLLARLRWPMDAARRFRAAFAAREPKFTGATGFLLVACILSLPLVWNEGYFSQDELQWLAFADKPTLTGLPWSAWFDFSPFQYRPLTFNLWLLLSHFFGYQPIVMHLIRVLFGLAAAWLLRAVMLQLDVAPRRAAWACWIWLLTPYTVYTHGWVGTFGDSLCLIFMLMALRFVLRQATGSWRQSALCALPVAALTVLALMSKESAVVFPAVILIAAFRRRDKIAVAAFALASLVVATYLALRLPTILFPAHSAQGYAWHLANIPANVAGYTLFPFLVGHFEVIAARTHLTNWPALLSLAIVATASASTGRRRFALFCSGWILALGPVLILDGVYNQYAYLAGTWACAFFACSWGKIPTPLRVLMIIPIAMALAHGAQQVREIRHIGTMQRNLYADLTTQIAQGDTPILIEAKRNQDGFILRRLLTDIPTYRHLSLNGRVKAVSVTATDERPNFLMAADGRLVPAD
ncbi:MAG: DUF2029 domain-containing protein [Xanthomonadaceae bacterium]|nr:DUF2029 domain-containing protein [Xanthomonadaceae bacterium]